MTDYTQETIDKSAVLLPVNLRYLFLELELYLDLSGPEFIYTNELSTIWRRIGECEAQAEAIAAVAAMQILSELSHAVEKLRTDYRVARFELKELTNILGEYVSELDYQNSMPPISVDNYREA